MKRLIAFTIFLIIAIVGYSQSGISTFKYETRFPSIRVGGATKVKLDSITQSVDTIKFYTGATELVTNGAGIWTGTGVRLDTTLAKITLGIDQVPNLSLAAMFNDPIFTGVSYFGHSAVPTTPGTGYLGVSDNPWAGLYLGATSPLSWGNSVFLTGGTGQVSLSGGNLSLGSNSLLMTGSLGATASRLTKGWFTDIESTNRPTVGAALVALQQDISDSLGVFLADATVGVALADSNIYDGGYLTLTYADSLLEDVSNPLLRELRMLGADMVAIPVSASQLLTSYTNMTENRAYYTAMYLDKDTILTGVKWVQRVQGVYTADNFNGVALYSWDGSTATQVAISADDGNCWKGGAYTLQTKAFGSPYSASKGMYYVAFLYNTSSESTPPSIYDWNTVSAVSQIVTGGPKVSGYVGSMDSLPATETAGDMTTDGQLHGVWLY